MSSYHESCSYSSFIDDPDFHEKVEAETAMNEMKKRQEILDAKGKEIRRLEYESNLIRGDICSAIRNDFPKISRFNLFSWFNGDLLPQAWRYFNLGDSDAPVYKEKETKDKEKASLELVDSKMRKTFFPFDENAKLAELSRAQYREAYDFVYECMGNKIHIMVPSFAHASEDNYLYMLKGYVAYYEESELSRVEFASNLEYAELTKEIESFVKKETKEEK